MADILTPEQVACFDRDGFLHIPRFYDHTEIESIQRAIYDVIGLVIARHKLSIARRPFSSEHFDSGFMELVAANRRYGSEVYDAVKMIPAFVRLAACQKNERLQRQLSSTTIAGFIPHGYGIRIDLPGEDKFRTLWHQEYLFQLRSLDGLTLWSPLVPITQDLGPVCFALGSHRSGIHKVYNSDANKPGAYNWRILNEQEIVGRYSHTAPLANPGDVIVLSFQVLHCSGINRSFRPRWSMQMRFFNFLEQTGLSDGWPGSVAEGVNVPELYPQFFASQVSRAS